MDILHSKIIGENNQGTPLLVFHGLFGMLDNWGSFGQLMSEHMPVHLMDLRNHGRSFHSDEMSHEAMADDILRYMTAQGIDKAHLLGHSLGGKAVMQFALTYPEKVEKLIVVDIAPKAYPPHHQGIIKALQSVDFDAVKGRGDVEKILSEYIPEKSVVLFLTKNLYWNDEKQLRWRFNLPILASKYDEFVTNSVRDGEFDGPTLFVSGAKSDYILPEDSTVIRQQFPQAEFTVISNAGHWVQAENPTDFNKTVEQFLID